MSLDATHTKLTRYGKVVVEGGEIIVTGYDGKNCTCRDLAVLAMCHAIGVLQDELMRTIEKPGGTGKCGIGD